LELRNTRASHPGVGKYIARAQAQGLDDMSLGFFGATNKNLKKSDAGMSVGEISIQRQRVFDFGDALRSPLRPHLDIPQQRMAAAVVGDREQGLVPYLNQEIIGFLLA
jgi:hypothetical protein